MIGPDRRHNNAPRLYSSANNNRGSSVDPSAHSVSISFLCLSRVLHRGLALVVLLERSLCQPLSSYRVDPRQESRIQKASTRHPRSSVSVILKPNKPPTCESESLLDPCPTLSRLSIVLTLVDIRQASLPGMRASADTHSLDR